MARCCDLYYIKIFKLGRILKTLYFQEGAFGSKCGLMHSLGG